MTTAPRHSVRALIPTVALLALALAGCTDSAPEEAPSETGESSPAEQSSTPEESQTTEEATGETTPADADLREVTFAVGPEDALQSSADEVGADGIVHQIELDHSGDRGMWIWEIQTLVDGIDHEVEINADTGEVVDHEQDPTADTEQPVDLQHPMTFDEALDLATGEVDGPLRGWKLEWDDGITAYELDIDDGSGDEVEVTVNVETRETYVDR